MTTHIPRQQYKLRYQHYGSFGDWVMLYHVWVDEAGRVEHAARKRLQQYKIFKMYKKDGSSQKAREMVQCTFSIALSALTECVGTGGSEIWKSRQTRFYEFGGSSKVMLMTALSKISRSIPSACPSSF
jgi:hypothetical protein